MKSFTLFTKDVPGEMKPRRVYADGPYEVIPAGTAQDRETRHRAAVAAFELACAAALASRRKPVRDSRSAPVHGAMYRLDHAIADLERHGSIPDAPNAGPSVSQMMRQHSRSAGAQARICAEAQAAYAARNPHTREAAV